MKNLNKNFKEVIVLSLYAIPIAVLIGILEFIYTKGVIFFQNINKTNVIIFTLLMTPICIIINYIVKYYFKKNINIGSGMNYVFDAGLKNKNIPLILIPFCLFANWLSILVGASVGREGIAVQLGATLSNNIAKRLKKYNLLDKFTIIGISAGFSGAFLKPISSAFFAIEVLENKKYRFWTLIPALVSAYISYYITCNLGLNGFNYNLDYNINYNFLFIIKIILLSMIFGLTGMTFSYLLVKTSIKFSKFINNKAILLILTFILSMMTIFFHMGRYSGTGSNLINFAFNNNVYKYDFILKFAFTILCLSIGFKGGEVTPLFTIGATLGTCLSTIFNLPFDLTSILGYICVFGAGTNTILCPIFIGCEIVGFKYMPIFIIACIVSNFFNFNISFYTKQKGTYFEK